MLNKQIYHDAPEYCHYFFDLVTTDDLLFELEKSLIETNHLFTQINTLNENHCYQPGKWTIKQVIRHIIDCERVYTYRAFRFSRLDNVNLAGFDENVFIANIPAEQLILEDMIEEYRHVRAASILLFKHMTDVMLDHKGTANNAIFTARSLGFMTVGHNLHHCRFIAKHYL